MRAAWTLVVVATPALAGCLIDLLFLPTIVVPDSTVTAYPRGEN